MEVQVLSSAPTIKTRYKWVLQFTGSQGSRSTIDLADFSRVYIRVFLLTLSPNQGQNVTIRALELRLKPFFRKINKLHSHLKTISGVCVVDAVKRHPYNPAPCCCGVEQSGSSTGS